MFSQDKRAAARTGPLHCLFTLILQVMLTMSFRPYFSCTVLEDEQTVYDYPCMPFVRLSVLGLRIDNIDITASQLNPHHSGQCPSLLVSSTL